MDYMLFIVAVLLVLAIADLIVGVSNDAVNFLNSAIGSRVTTYRNIILIASAGILAGCFFSSGMMEIARKGIFQPQHFTFDKVMRSEEHTYELQSLMRISYAVFCL